MHCICPRGLEEKSDQVRGPLSSEYSNKEMIASQLLSPRLLRGYPLMLPLTRIAVEEVRPKTELTTAFSSSFLLFQFNPLTGPKWPSPISHLPWLLFSS